MNPSPGDTVRAPADGSASSAMATRRSLLDRLKDPGDDPSWEEFVGRYRGLIEAAVRQRGVPAGDADEVVQETLVALARGLPRYDYDPARCRFKNWIRAIAERRVADHFRRQRRRQNLLTQDRPDPDDADAGAGWLDALEVPDERQLPPDAAWDAAWQERLLELAMQQVRDEVKPAAFRIYHELVIRHRAPLEVARLFQVSLPRVYLARHRVGSLVRRRYRELELDPLRQRGNQSRGESGTPSLRSASAPRQAHPAHP